MGVTYRCVDGLLYHEVRQPVFWEVFAEDGRWEVSNGLWSHSSGSYWAVIRMGGASHNRRDRKARHAKVSSRNLRPMPTLLVCKVASQHPAK